MDPLPPPPEGIPSLQLENVRPSSSSDDEALLDAMADTLETARTGVGGVNVDPAPSPGSPAALLKEPSVPPPGGPQSKEPAVPPPGASPRLLLDRRAQVEQHKKPADSSRLARPPVAQVGLPPGLFSNLYKKPSSTSSPTLSSVRRAQPEDMPAVSWRRYCSSRWRSLHSIIQLFDGAKEFISTRAGAGSAIAFAILLIFEFMGRHLLAYCVNCICMVMLLIPSGVMVLLLSPLPGPILPFPYLFAWRLTAGWLELPYSSIVALGLVLVIAVHLPGRVMARDTVKLYNDQLLVVLFAWPYYPVVDGQRYSGIDMTGFLPRTFGMDGVYHVTIYGLLTIASGCWLLLGLLWPVQTITESGPGGLWPKLWVSGITFVLYVVTAALHAKETQIKQLHVALQKATAAGATSSKSKSA